MERDDSEIRNLYKKYLNVEVINTLPLNGISNDVFKVKDPINGFTVGKIFPKIKTQNLFTRNEFSVSTLVNKNPEGKYKN